MATQKTKEELINELNSILEPGNVLVENEDYFVAENEIRIRPGKLHQKLKKDASIDPNMLCRQIKSLPFYLGRYAMKTKGKRAEYLMRLHYSH